MNRRNDMTSTTKTTDSALTRVAPLDAAMRTGMASGAQEMVSAYGAPAADGRLDLHEFLGDASTEPWPALTVVERATF